MQGVLHDKFHCALLRDKGLLIQVGTGRCAIWVGVPGGVAGTGGHRGMGGKKTIAAGRTGGCGMGVGVLGCVSGAGSQQS